MRTNFQMVCEFVDYMPAESGLIEKLEEELKRLKGEEKK